jgi:hypothetical protein
MINDLIRSEFNVIHGSEWFWFILYGDRLFQASMDSGVIDISNVVTHKRRGESKWWASERYHLTTNYKECLCNDLENIFITINIRLTNKTSYEKAKEANT